MKQVILVRMDLKLPKGKLASQVAHAAVACYANSNSSLKKEWISEGMKKIVLKVKDLEELEHYASLAKKNDLVCELISDAGRTVVEPGTITCLGIGPDEEELIDKVTGNLKIL